MLQLGVGAGQFANGALQHRRILAQCHLSRLEFRDVQDLGDEVERGAVLIADQTTLESSTQTHAILANLRFSIR